MLFLTDEGGGLAGVHVHVLGHPHGDHEVEQLLHAEGGLVPPARQDLGLHRRPGASCRELDFTRNREFMIEILEKHFPIKVYCSFYHFVYKERNIKFLKVDW